MTRMNSVLFQNTSIKWKLVLAIVFVSTTVLVISGMPFFIFEYSSVQNMIARDVETISKVTAKNSIGALAFDDAKSANATLAALSVKLAIVAACLYDRDGKVFATYYRHEKHQPLPSAPGRH